MSRRYVVNKALSDAQKAAVKRGELIRVKGGTIQAQDFFAMTFEQQSALRRRQQHVKTAPTTQTEALFEL